MGVVRPRRNDLDEAVLGQGLTGDEARIAQLGGMMTAWLARRSRRPGFPPLLEAQFERDCESTRRRSFRLMTLICLAGYVAYLPLFCRFVPDEIMRSIEAQLGVAVPFCLLAVWVIRRPRSRLVRESAFSLVSLTCMFASIWSYQPSHAPLASSLRDDMLLYGLIYCNLVLGLRFPFAAFTTSVMVAASIADHALAPSLSFDFRLHALVTTGYTAFFTLLGNYQLELGERRNYILRLRDHLRVYRLSDSNEGLKALSMLDPLTGLANRRGFDVAFTAAWGAAVQASGQMAGQLGVLMIDVDLFKSYNDHHGHPAGDECLRRIAGALHAAVRLQQDTVARYGGEEFVAVIPGAGETQCMALAERMRVAVEGLGLPHHGHRGGAIVTVSIGVATVRPGSPAPCDGILEAADHALYEAKNAGRNRVVAAPAAAGAAQVRSLEVRGLWTPKAGADVADP